MSSKTLARPYARAIFEHSEGLLEELRQVVNVIHQPNVTALIDSPKLAYKEKAEMFIDLFKGRYKKRQHTSSGFLEAPKDFLFFQKF